MGKGVTALQNIQLLKWCKELGITVSWNIIWGFPGEPAGEYARMAALVPHLTHLEPPEYAGPISLERFSPNYDFADRLGFVHVAVPNQSAPVPNGSDARIHACCPSRTSSEK